MIVRRISEEKDGQVEVSLAMSKDQATYLMNVGLSSLIATGMAVIQDMTRQQFEEEMKTLDAAEESGAPAPAVQQETNDENSTTRH